MRLRRATRALTALPLVVYVGGLALVTLGFFEPAARPGLAFWFVLLCALELGLLSGRWWVVPLGLLAAVPATRIGNDEVDVVLVPPVALFVVVLVTVAVVVRRRARGVWVARAGVGALCLALV